MQGIKRIETFVAVAAAIWAAPRGIDIPEDYMVGQIAKTIFSKMKPILGSSEAASSLWSRAIQDLTRLLKYVFVDPLIALAYFIEKLTRRVFSFEKQPANVPNNKEIDRILQKEDCDRSVAEKMQLYSWLVEVGSDRAKQVQGRDVVLVIGNTGAGKSTCVDYLLGCTMENNNGKVVVAKDSKIKEWAEIGLSIVSATLIPNIIPAIQGQADQKTEQLVYIDSPGLSDNRGIEVALANAIVMNKCISCARTVRIVLLFEAHMLSGERGQKWKDMGGLVKRKFDINENHGNSLLVLISKALPGMDIQQTVADSTPTKQPSLAKSLYPYNPMDSTLRIPLLEKILQLRAHEKLPQTIQMSLEQLGEANRLGNQVKGDIQNYLSKGSADDIANATKIARFSYGIKQLGNPDLESIHNEVEKAVIQHTRTVVEKINPNKNPALSKQVEAYHQFLSLKSSFEEFFSREFRAIDDDVASMRKSTKDPRWVAADKPFGLLTSGAASFAATLIVGSYFRPLAIIPGLFGVGVTIANLKRMWLPTEEERAIDAFFHGL